MKTQRKLPESPRAFWNEELKPYLDRVGALRERDPRGYEEERRQRVITYGSWYGSRLEGSVEVTYPKGKPRRDSLDYPILKNETIQGFVNVRKYFIPARSDWRRPCRELDIVISPRTIEVLGNIKYTAPSYEGERKISQVLLRCSRGRNARPEVYRTFQFQNFAQNLVRRTTFVRRYAKKVGVSKEVYVGQANNAVSDSMRKLLQDFVSRYCHRR